MSDRRALKRRLVAAAPVVAAMAVLIAAAYSGWSQDWARPRFREIAFDVVNRLSPRPASDAPVRIVDIDETSLARIGQWPWPRTRIAELIQRLREAGTGAVAFDIVFSEPDRTSPAQAAAQWPESSELRRLLADLPDHDLVLAEAIAGGGVVTSFIATDTAASGRFPAAKATAALVGAGPLRGLPEFTGALPSLPPIEAAAAGNGALNFVPGSDGVVRRVPLLLRIGDGLYPTLATEALRVAIGARNILLQPDERGMLTELRLAKLRIPTDGAGALWLHFRKTEEIALVPAWRVLAGEALPELDGAIVFVGTSAPGLLDLRFGPLGQLPGVAMHAMAAEQVLAGDFLSRPGWADGAELLYLLFGAAIVLYLVMHAGPLPSAGAVLAIAGLGMGLAWWGFVADGLLLEPIYPALALVTVFLAGFVPRQFLAEREGKWIRSAFSSYVSPNLVDHLIANPEQLRLGGERRECSFVLTDIAGFTSLVESADPATLIGVLNEYIDGMVSIAFQNEGTLDKVVGDAVAVMFSAPLVQPDHAARAVACALAMDAFAQGFAKARRDAGIPLGTTRIGAHTGSVIVGNVGGATLDYRPLGDAINTASRLETVNKQLGTRVCVSDATAQRCPGFLGRKVGELVLKGKTEAILCWQPLPPADSESEAVAAYRAAYEMMERGDPAALAAFERLPDDPLARFHAERLARGETGAVVVMQEK